MKINKYTSKTLYDTMLLAIMVKDNVTTSSLDQKGQHVRLRNPVDHYDYIMFCLDVYFQKRNYYVGDKWGTHR